ncbi:unnamed protein product [Lasius platythorax]|uniref:Uncharacterized protein n=1 Tax=Lasius platythorax TaxID=488582 RepID=A0AAV2P4N4_9HYME
MKAIGRILTCVLLAAVFGKNVIATSAANIKFSTGQNNKIVRFNTTRSELVPEPSPLNPEDSRGILDIVFKNEDDQGIARYEEARTFGKIRRLQFMLMPLIYKMGVMMTMLMVLTAISVKGLFVGIILLVLKLATFLAKFYTGWHAASQPIHLHIHNSSPYVQSVHPQMYHNWVPMSGPGDHYY